MLPLIVCLTVLPLAIALVLDWSRRSRVRSRLPRPSESSATPVSHIAARPSLVEQEKDAVTSEASKQRCA